MRWLAPFVCVLALLVAGCPSARAEERVALVVGNGAYTNTSPLRNPRHDAEAVTETLKALGFKVHVAVDAPLAAMLRTIDGFVRDLTGAEAALFYYSGHGMQLGAENYLLPTDIAVESDLSIRYGAVAAGDLINQMERRARVAIVILDACRDNPFVEVLNRQPGATRSAAASRGLARLAPEGNGTIVAFSARAGTVARDGEDTHSPYTTALLEELPRAGVEVGLVFRRIAGRVVKATQGAQTPELLMRLNDEFYLQPTVAVAAAETSTVAPGGAETPSLAVTTATPAVSAVGSPATAETPPSVAKSLSAAVEEGSLPAAGDSSKGIADQRFAALWSYAPPLRGAVPRPAPAAYEAPAGMDVVEHEPNGLWREAGMIGGNDTVRMTLDPRGDVDRFLLPLGAQGLLKLVAAGVPPEIDLAARLIDTDGNVVADWIRAPRLGGTIESAIDIPRAGLYRLELRDWGDDGWSASPFTAALAFTPSPDAAEPNDSIGKASALTLPATIPLTILPRRDQDWFAIESAVQGELSVSLTDSPQALELALRVVDENGVFVADWARPPRPGGETRTTASLARPGRYLIQVVEWGDDASSVEPATLRVDFRPNPDKTEPNASASRAYPIARDGTRDLTIFPRGDRDWLAVDIVEPGRLTVDLTEAYQTLDLAFRVVDADQVALTDWTRAPRPGGDVSGEADIARPGRYLIEIAEWGDDAWSLDPFKVRLGFATSPDRFEPNDSVAFARPLTPGGEVAFTMLPRRDRDLFRLSVDRPGELAVAIDEGPPDQDLRFRILDSDGGILTNWVAPYATGGRTEGFADLRIAGDYLLEIAEWGDDQASPEPAVLSTRLTPVADAQEPNDTPATAAPLVTESEMSAAILPRGDIDHFVYRAETAGRLAVALTGIDSALDLAFRALDADGNLLANWQRAGAPGGNITAEVAVPSPGPVTIEVREWGDDARSTVPFRITARFTANP